jgi:hypothetical protein
VRSADIASRTAVAGAEAMARPRSATDISAGMVIDPNNPANPVTYLQPGDPVPQLKFGQIYIPPRAPNPETVQTLSAAEASGKEGGAASAKLATDTVNEAQAAGFRANELASKVARLREIMPYLNNQNPLQQVAGSLADHIQQEFGVTVGAGQSARNVWNTMVNQLLPELKDDYGFQRVAAPEIALAQGGMPMGNLDAGAISRIVNALDATARMNQQVANLGAQARRASPGPGGITADAYDKFLQGRAAIDPMAVLNAVRQQYPEAPLGPTKTAPSQTQPTIRVNPTTGAVERLGPDGKWGAL